MRLEVANIAGDDYFSAGLFRLARDLIVSDPDQAMPATLSESRALIRG